MAKPLTKASIALLAQICAAQTAGTMFYASDDALKGLVEHGKVEVHPTATDPANPTLRAVRATPGAMTDYAASQNVQPGANTPAVSTFEIVKGVVLPPVKRRGGKGAAVYPFDTMEVGDGFFVPATAERPNPAKALTSTTASATRRYATKGEPKPYTRKDKTTGQPVTKMIDSYTPTRVFEVRAVDDGAPCGAKYAGQKGAIVARTA